MDAVTVSPKYQITIPKLIRKKFDIHPGERMVIIPYEDRIEMMPERDIKSMRGFLKGIDIAVEREDDRV